MHSNANDVTITLNVIHSTSAAFLSEAPNGLRQRELTMKRTIVSTLAVLAVLAMAGVSDANDADASSQRLQRLVNRFHKADVNGDGQLTRDEAKQGMPRVYQHFSEIDKDNKGFVTLTQIASFLEAHPNLEHPRSEKSPPPAAAPPPAAPPAQ
jgi:hypothetical protein